MYKIKPEDQFLIIASDGVWEFIENDEIIEIVKRHKKKNDIEGACDEIMKESLLRWKIEEEDSIDDITFVLVFFDSNDDESKLRSIRRRKGISSSLNSS